MKATAKIVVVISLLVLGCIWQGAKNGNSWTTARNSLGVKLQYRWLVVGDSLKTREMRCVFKVKANSADIIRNIKSSKQQMKWNEGVKDCKLLKNQEREWIHYTLYDIPKPFAQQDLVSKYKILKTGNVTQIRMQSKPHLYKKVKGVNRQKHYSGKWIFKPLPGGYTHVEFRSISYSEPLLPRFVQDPILQKMLIKSFNNLRQLSE